MTLFDDPIDTGVLYRDDNLTVLQELSSESVDLAYLDPPFFSNRRYEVIWGEEAEVRSFEDRWAGGIQNYVDWMSARVEQLHRVLKPTGSLYVHCDPHASHYLKVMLDGIFGGTNFRNEIVWKRTSGRKGMTQYGRVHDVLFFYTKGKDATWNPPQIPQDATTVRGHDLLRQGGRVYRLSDLSGVGEGPPRTFGDRGEIAPPRSRHWQFDQAGIDRLMKEGRITFSRTGKPRLKTPLKDLPGVAVTDVWTDIDPINAAAAERLGYPTQKPESLLQRIVGASSNPGDIILDPFCGCGTTVAVAERLKRKWVGIDISATAVEIMRRRLLKLGYNPRIENAVQTIEDLKQLKPFEFQNWIVNAIYGSHSTRRVHDMGIDGYWFYTRDPIQVKQSERVGRNVVDNFETAMRRNGSTTGYIIAFSFGKGAVEEVARARKDGLEIKLVKVAEILLLMKRPHGKFGPQPGGVDELPIPASRKPEDMPSAEELINSDTSHAAG